MIRKFLDAQRMPQLAEYLEALHKQGLANSEHTTLLINCYTKLKEKEKLHDFIYSDQAGIHFDIEMAIEVLRRAQCFEEALHLSKKHHLFTTFLRIQIEDKQDLRAATDYIKYCFFFHFNAGPFPLSLLPQPCSYTVDNFLPITASKQPICSSAYAFLPLRISLRSPRNLMLLPAQPTS